MKYVWSLAGKLCQKMTVWTKFGAKKILSILHDNSLCDEYFLKSTIVMPFLLLFSPTVYQSGIRDEMINPTFTTLKSEHTSIPNEIHCFEKFLWTTFLVENGGKVYFSGKISRQLLDTFSGHNMYINTCFSFKYAVTIWYIYKYAYICCRSYEYIH